MTDPDRVQMTEKGWKMVDVAEALMAEGLTIDDVSTTVETPVQVLEVLLAVANISREMLEEELRG